MLIACVADEEVASIGMAEVLKHVRADAAVVTEATELRVCLAHRGFSWIEVETLGFAAHGSRFDLGIDANMRMGRFLARLDELEQDVRARAPHALVGPPVASRGGAPWRYRDQHVCDRCRLEIERRTIPGETEAQVLSEIRAHHRRVGGGGLDVPSKCPCDADPWVVRGRSQRTDRQRDTRRGHEPCWARKPDVIGEPYWMDAALLSDVGIDTVVIGPSGAGAHALEEWVELDSVVKLTDILTRGGERVLRLEA